MLGNIGGKIWVRDVQRFFSRNISNGNLDQNSHPYGLLNH